MRPSLMRFFLAASCAIAASLSGCGPDTPADVLVANGTKAYEAGEYDKARSLWQDAIAQGSIEATYRLGVLANEGRAGQDATDAFAYFENAAGKGHAKAQYNLALAYERGLGVVRDREKSLHWLHKAAAQGNADAQYMIGLLLLGERDAADSAPQAPAEAISWFERAAGAGNTNAQLQLGTLYLEGKLVPEDPGKAIRWFGAALENGEIMALRPMLEAREATTRPQTGIAQLQEQSSRGDPEARHELASRYFNGRGVERDRDQAMQLLREAAGKGYPPAQYDLGMTYAYGDSPDLATALEWIRKAAGQRYAKAQYALGQAAAEGWESDPDDAIAVDWYRRAAELGMPQAQYALGHAYSEGAGVPGDDSLAMSWFRKAAGHGHAEAAFRISTMYAEGEGVSKNPVEVRRWACRALVLGSDRAQSTLQRSGGLDGACSEFREDLVQFTVAVLGDPAVDTGPTPDAKPPR